MFNKVNEYLINCLSWYQMIIDDRGTAWTYKQQC